MDSGRRACLACPRGLKEVFRTSYHPLAACAIVAVLLPLGAARAQTVWSGPTITFTKPDFADWTQEENQDRITDLVWITRQNGQGIFNIAQESGFGPGSPADTEWAFGSAVDWQDLAFQSWFDWHGGNPPSVVDVDAVVHLITDDIYIDIKFTSWSSGGSGGGFSYERSTLPAPPALALLALAGLRRRRSHAFIRSGRYPMFGGSLTRISWSQSCAVPAC